jgi:Fic family protein
MEKLLNWISNPEKTDRLVVAGIAHLWFLTIHPFENGNGRIARAITETLLARSEDNSVVT